MSSLKVQISVSDSRCVGTLQRKKSEIIFLSFGSRFTPVLWGPTRRGPANRIRPQLLVKENQALTYITGPDQEETSASRCIPLCGIKVLSTRFICPIAATSFHWRLRADWRDNGQTAACVRSWPFDRPNATLFALWCHRRRGRGRVKYCTNRAENTCWHVWNKPSLSGLEQGESDLKHDLAAEQGFLYAATPQKCVFFLHT